MPLFKPRTEWLPPEDFPDLSKHDEISIDLEKAKHFIDMIIERDYPKKDFLEEAEKEKKELAECYKEAKRQTEERKPKDKPNSWGIIK